MSDPLTRRPLLRLEISARTLGFVLIAGAAVWCAIQLANVLIVVAVALIIVGTKEEQIYEQLTVGATAANAGVIAGELAEKTKETERTEHALCMATASMIETTEVS